MDKTRKKRMKRVILWFSLGVLVLVLTLMPLLARQKQEERTASILSGTVTAGDLTVALHVGGTLEAGEAEDVELPADVKIKAFLVRNGDMVTKGTALAEVDKVSVLTAITQIQDSMEQLRREITNLGDEKGPTTVYATAGGRVKEVFAQPDDRVEDVLLEHGALAVLSLDERMGITLKVSSDLTTGDAVLVTLADGTQVDGRVESNLGGELKVTVEDKGYASGLNAVVARPDGAEVGTGTLEIHSPWAATALTGTVSTVLVKPEQTLSSGASLFGLKDTDYTAQKELLAGTHREYEALLQDLFRMYETGVIEAPCDGMISGIDKDSAHLLSAQAEEEYEVELLSNTNRGPWKLVLLSNAEGEPQPQADLGCTKGLDCPLKPDEQHLDGCIMACDRNDPCDAAVHHSDCIKTCTHAAKPEECPCTGTAHYKNCINACNHEASCEATEYHYKDCISLCISSDGSRECPAQRHKENCIKFCTHADNEANCPAVGKHYTDCIKSCIDSRSADNPCPASRHKNSCYYVDVTYKALAAKVDAVGKDLVLLWDASGQPYAVERSGSGWVLSGGGQVDEKLLIDKKGDTVPADGSYSKGDIILYVYSYKGGSTTGVPMGPVLYKKAPAIPQIPSFSLPNFNFGVPSFSFSTPGLDDMTDAESSLFSLKGDVLMTVTPQDTMTLSIALDEADISKVSLGKTGQIRVNALGEETYPAEITRIAASGTSSGGSGKFAVELTLPRQGQMIAGMGASAMIPLETKEQVLTVPVAALVEDGANTVVYTALDKKTGDPTAPVTVQTGVSDGENVEILSGLSDGDSFYYSYYDQLELSDAVEIDQFPFD